MKACCESPVEYRLLEHTADLGIEVRAADLAELFARAGAALADLLYDPAPVAETLYREVLLDERDREILLVRWLNELIFLREVEEFLWKRVEVEIDGAFRLRAVLLGEAFEATRHVPRTGLKAATYHMLCIEAGPQNLVARVLFDV